MLLFTQVELPVLQLVTPTTHTLGLVVQFTPAAHALHAPALHTWLVPQVVPFATFDVESVQTLAPDAQEVVPTLQGFGLPVHAADAVHALHDPALQTLFVPQLWPFGVFVAESMQVVVPVAHEVMPALHGFGLVLHAAPAVHEAQVPALHTLFAPQLWPFGWSAAESTQVCAPVAHEVTPTLQGVGLPVQALPAVHATHAPVWQT